MGAVGRAGRERQAGRSSQQPVHSPPSPCHGLLSACLQLKENPKPEAGFVSKYLTCRIFLSRQTHCLTWAVRRSNAVLPRPNTRIAALRLYRKNAAQEEFGKARCKEFLETQ